MRRKKNAILKTVQKVNRYSYSTPLRQLAGIGLARSPCSFASPPFDGFAIIGGKVMAVVYII
jgi:hypothetical protein